MLRSTLLASMAVVLAALGTSTIASAREHHKFHTALITANGTIVDANENDNDDENDDDVVSVAEPVYYAPVQQQSYVMQTASYVPVNDTIVTPYGYTPVYNNGYYQGYGYNPQYAYNPYYASAAYAPADPVSSAVVNTVVAAAANGGHVSGQTLIQSLVGGLLAAQAQQQYQQQYGQVYGQPVYQQQYVQQPVYQQQYVQQPVYYPQAARVIQQVMPGVVTPVYVRHDNGEHRGWYKQERGEGHGHGGDGDHGDND